MPPPDDYNRRCLTSKSGYWVWKSAFCPRIHSMKISLYLQCIKTSHGDPISLACRKRRHCTMILRKDRKSKIPCHNRSMWHVYVHEIEPCCSKGLDLNFADRCRLHVMCVFLDSTLASTFCNILTNILKTCFKRPNILRKIYTLFIASSFFIVS